MTTTVKTFRELSAQEFFRICEVREQVFVLEQKITLCAELDEQDLHSTHISVTEGGKIALPMPVAMLKVGSPTSAGCSQPCVEKATAWK